MEWFRQIIICASSQPSHNVLCLSHTGQDNDVCVRTLRTLSDSAAHLDAADIWHNPVRNDHIGAVLVEQLDGFKAVFREKNREQRAWKRVLNQFSIHG